MCTGCDAVSTDKIGENVRAVGAQRFWVSVRVPVNTHLSPTQAILIMSLALPSLGYNTTNSRKDEKMDGQVMMLVRCNTPRRATRVKTPINDMDPHTGSKLLSSNGAKRGVQA